MFLLDTNAWVTYLRGRNPLLRQRLAAGTTGEVAVCSSVTGELLYGALRSANPTHSRQAVEALVAPYLCLPFDALAADEFATLRHELDLAGTPIGPYDMQIAAIALVHGCTVVTHNVVEFRSIPGLNIEDWEVPLRRETGRHFESLTLPAPCGCARPLAPPDCRTAPGRRRSCRRGCGGRPAATPSYRTC